MKAPGEIPTQEEAVSGEITMTPEIAEALEQNTVAFLDAMEKRIQDKLWLPEWVKPQNKVERYAMIAVVCGWQGDQALKLPWCGHVANRRGEELPAEEQVLIRELYEPSGILAELEAKVRQQLAASYEPEKGELAEKVKHLGLEVAAPTLHETLVAAQEKYHDLIGSGRWGRAVTPICAEDLLAYQALKAGEYRNPQDIIYGRE